LPLAEFSYNNAPSITTSISSFFANKSYYLNISIYSEHNIAFFWAYDFANELQSTLKAEITIAQQYYQKSVNV